MVPTLTSHLPEQLTSWDATLHATPAESLIWDAILAEESGPEASLWLMRVFGILLALWVISVMIMGLSHSYFGGTCYQSISVRSVHGGSQWKLYLNYLAFLPLHFMRSTDTSTGQNNQLYSPSEREFLTSKRRILDDSVLNFLSVRRSMTFVSFLFLMVGMLMQVSDLPCAFQRRAVWLEKSSIEVEGHVMTFSEYVKMSNQKNKTWSAQDPEAFWSYSKALYTGMFAKVLRQTSAIDIFQSCANAFCQVARCVCLYQSLLSWPDFHQSHRGVFRALFFSVMAPLVATSIPARIFIDWSVLTPVVDTFTSELGQHLASQRDSTVKQIRHLCQMLLDVSRRNDQRAVERAVEMCKLLVMAPNKHVKCCSFAPVVDFDFRPIHETCQVIFKDAQNPQGSILQNATRESAEMAAQMCRDTIIPNMEKGMELGFQDSVEILASASPIAAQMAQSVSIGLGFVHGLKGAQAIVPAAIALVPALLRSALKVKVIVPQSVVPGMFVVALPLLYCPMAWGLYHIVFQLLGDWWMLVGLLVLAFSPMIYLAFGMYYRITRHMTDNSISRAMQSINIASSVVAVIGYIFITAFAWNKYNLTIMEPQPGDKHTVERDAYRFVIQQVKVLQGSFWLEFACVCMANYFFTTLAGVDWMMMEIGRQRNYEILMQTAQEISRLEGATDVCYPDGLQSQEEREEAVKAAEERGNRLDSVFHVVYDEEPMNLRKILRGRRTRFTVLDMEMAEIKTDAIGN